MKETRKKIKRPYDKLEMKVVEIGKTCIVCSSLDPYGDKKEDEWPNNP